MTAEAFVIHFNLILQPTQQQPQRTTLTLKRFINISLWRYHVFRWQAKEIHQERFLESVNSRYSEIDNDPTKALAGVRHGERD